MRVSPRTRVLSTVSREMNKQKRSQGGWGGKHPNLGLNPLPPICDVLLNAPRPAPLRYGALVGFPDLVSVCLTLYITANCSGRNTVQYIQCIAPYLREKDHAWLGVLILCNARESKQPPRATWRWCMTLRRSERLQFVRTLMPSIDLMSGFSSGWGNVWITLASPCLDVMG